MATVYKRGNAWWIRFRHDGQHIRRSAKTSKKAEAQAFLHQLVDEYCTRGGRTVVRYQLTEVLGEFVAIRKRTGVTDATIRRDLSFLGSIFTAAIRRGWVDTSPVTALNKKALKESRPRIRFITRDEFSRLHYAASETLKPILVLAVETGMRKEELLSLQLPQIDLRRREVYLKITKTSSPRRVPLSVTAADTIRHLLERQDRPTSLFLFCKPDGARSGDPEKGFNAACNRAGLADFRYHDLMHTFASWWVQEGGDLYRLSRVLGHATLQMTARYGHLRTEDLHEEMERVTQKRSQDRISATISATV